MPYYTNSTLLPVGITSDVFFALEHQDALQTLYTGGTVFHTFLGEAAPDEDSVKHFLLKAMTNTKIPYISITPTFSICENHGYIYGEHFSCPTCGKDAEVYTRVVGYYRPVGALEQGQAAGIQRPGGIRRGVLLLHGMRHRIKPTGQVHDSRRQSACCDQAAQ